MSAHEIIIPEELLKEIESSIDDLNQKPFLEEREKILKKNLEETIRLYQAQKGNPK